MPWLNIPDTTPLAIMVDFVQVDDVPPPAEHTLAGPAGALLLDNIPNLSTDQKAHITTLLSEGLPVFFQKLWADQQSNIQNQIANAVATSQHGYDATSTVPTTGGTLKASVDPLGPETAGLLPKTASGQDQPGQQLSLSYTVPGIDVNYTAASDPLLGTNWVLGILGAAIGTPKWRFSMDAQLNFYIAVPSDASVGMGFKVEFVAQNLSVLFPTNVAATLAYPAVWAWNILSIIFTQKSIFPSTETVAISDDSLTKDFGGLSQGFVSASAVGFTQLAVQINTDQQNAVQFDLTHPFDKAPTLTDYYNPWLEMQQIQLNKSVARPGDQITVTGTYWEALDPTTISIAWNDTTSGAVQESEVEFTRVFPPSFDKPSSTTPIPIDRTTAAGSAPVFQAIGLPHSATFAFRVRDFDVKDKIATAWSAWRNFITGPTLGTSVQIALSDKPFNALATTSILPGGAFVTTITIPISQTPGPYNVIATTTPDLTAQFPITIIDASQSLPAVLELYDPITGNPYAAPAAPNLLRVTPGNTYYLAGLNWAPGEVDVYVNSAAGQLLARPLVDSSGIFKQPFEIDEQGPTATQIWAQQGSVGVGLAIEELTVPK